MRKSCWKIIAIVSEISLVKSQMRQIDEGREQVEDDHRSGRPSTSRFLFFFFDHQGVVHKEFVPPGKTVNAQYYVEVLERLRKRVLRVRPAMSNTWKLHHDNAPCHTALLLKISSRCMRIGRLAILYIYINSGGCYLEEY
ncbi:hypothetical protein ANTPLA_LOCUS7740 [Anthophora plagiata]